ncbi:SAVED domain-containing protein [Sinorhizobium meliloti]|uniref:SAVED domain-containing protein n=1 Tax=Rhizobium meliloti TaxID=382 RepID=UPI000697C96C
MDRETVNWVIRETVKFLLRPRGFEAKIAAACIPILVTLLGWNWVLKATGRDNYSVEVGSTNVVPEWVQLPLVTLFVVIFVVCVWSGLRRTANEDKLRDRKKVIVIEGRGLREDDGSPLAAAVPSDIIGQRISVLLDLRQRKDGVIIDPAELLNEVDGTRRAVQQHSKQGDPQDVTLVYGGLTPVPLAFLTGIIFDDEGKIVVMDWDRTREAWRNLDSGDDGQRFQMEGFEDVGTAKEVVLAVSASYQVRDENIATTFDLPVARLSLPDLNTSHWSRDKQNALAGQLLEAAKLLEAKGVETIHLILAAQNSVAFNLGRRYDKRNLPSVIVYQYEASSEKKYPWGVRMPVRGERTPSIART